MEGIRRGGEERLFGIEDSEFADKRRGKRETESETGVRGGSRDRR